MLSGSLSDAAKGFFDAADPAMLLRMPGCTPLVANPAHDHYFDRQGWDSRRQRYEKFVAEPAGQLAEVTCYCEVISSILALREHECVFERAYQQLRDQPGAVFAGLEFHLVTQNPDKRSRLYSLSRVHARHRGGDLLEIRILPLPDLTVEVENLGEGLPPALWNCVVRFDANVWFRHQEKLDRLPDAYVAVDSALDRSRGSPSLENARRGILDSFRKVKESHVPPSHLLKHLFRESRIGPISDFDIRMLRERLCDARILRGRLVQRIERRLADHKQLLASSLTASPDKLVRLLRCTLELPSLEAADALAPPHRAPSVFYRPEKENDETHQGAESVPCGSTTELPRSQAPSDALDRLSREPDHQLRGYGLQKLLEEVFSGAEIPWHKSFTRNGGGEQIDGAFSLEGWFYIVECRWRTRLADIRQIDGLLGQVGRSGKQCMGLFLSIEGWSDNVLRLLKQNREKSILLMDGRDLRAVLEGRFTLPELLLRKLAHLNLRGEPFLGV